MSIYGLVQVFICIKGFQDVQIGTPFKVALVRRPPCELNISCTSTA